MATSMPELLRRVGLEELALGPAIVANPAPVDSCERGETMCFRARIQYVQHRTIGGDSGVRYQKAVAAPGKRFGTHDHRWLEPRQSQKIFERLVELARLHVVGVG